MLGVVPEEKVIGGKKEASPVTQAGPIILDSNSTEKVSERVLGVIPARLASTRLPKKMLRHIAGRPMLEWVYEAAVRCPDLHTIIVATDSEEIADLCRQRGWPFRMTSLDLPSGSDRVQAVAEEIPADIYVNIQGDEPLLRPEHLSALLRPFRRAHVGVSTLRVACPPESVTNPNVVKVVTSLDGRALYFSRSAIPFDREHSHPGYWKHIGLYAYRASALQQFTRLPYGELERAERLEQLRFLENGIAVYVETTGIDTIGVDTQEDLLAVERILGGRGPSPIA